MGVTNDDVDFVEYCKKIFILRDVEAVNASMEENSDEEDDAYRHEYQDRRNQQENDFYNKTDQDVRQDQDHDRQEHQTTMIKTIDKKVIKAVKLR